MKEIDRVEIGESVEDIFDESDVLRDGKRVFTQSSYKR